MSIRRNQFFRAGTTAAARVAVIAILFGQFPAQAQQSKDGEVKKIVLPASAPASEVPQTIQNQSPSQPEAKPAEEKPKDEAKKDGEKKEGEKKEGDKKDGEKKDGPRPVTSRPMKPSTPPDPNQLKNLKPDASGRLKFNLKGQPWPDVLEWLAETADKSLDWQELPNDYLNLVTQRSYSIDEARDLINRHLLARGFTMLVHGETIAVVNVAKINPGMVLRIDPSQLDRLPDHDFVKTSFALDWLLASEAESELKPMLSPNGKLMHLAATNRLEAMDSVLNLRQIWDVIRDEQTGGKQERLVREFKLKHTKAHEVVDQLHILLGMTKPSSRPRRSGHGDMGAMMSPDMMGQFQQQMQQMMQQMQQQQAQQAQQAQQPGTPGARKPAEVHLLPNDKENSVLANAPPDKMAVIAQAIKILDASGGNGENFLQNVQRMQVYRLSGIDPEAIIQLLEEVGNLEPTTKLQVDGKNKSIVAYASLADHLTIKLLVEKLDGTGRKFQVIPLRKLAADYVAGTIDFMMAGTEKDKNQNRRAPYYYDVFDPYMLAQSPRTDTNDKFRVDADVENNRLLLWANEIEVREIENLLIKLGELPPPGGNRNTQRYIENLDPDDAQQLLERVRRIWPGIAPNELIIEGAEPTRETKPAADAVEPNPAPRTAPKKGATKNKNSAPTKSSVPKSTGDPKANIRPVLSNARATTRANAKEVLQFISEPQRPRGDGDATPEAQSPKADDRDPSASEALALADHAAEIETDDAESPAIAPRPVNPQSAIRNPQTPDRPPIRIRRAPDGRLLLESPDTEALDQLEDLMREAAPPRKDFKVFKLKYPSTWAFSVRLALEDYFEVDDKKKNNNGFNPWWGWRFGNDANNDTVRRLSRRKPLKFISDSDSGTIIAQGADPQQLRIIQEIIDIYDQPPATDGKQVRKTQTFTLRYGNASVIAEAIKDVYRDLLSANDKAYQNQQGKEGQKPPERNYTFIYGGGPGNDNKQQPETPVKFKGLISLGVDELSNTIIVSAPESLLDNVSDLIDRLDRAARPTNSLQVVKVNNGVNTTELQKRLSKVLTKPQPKQPQQPRQPQQAQQPQQPAETPEEPVLFP